jgi:hypothetical protein
VPWEFCLAEWNAQFLGDRAYRIGEAEKNGSSAEFVGEFPREKSPRTGAGSPVARPTTSPCPVLAGAPPGGDASCPALR